MTSYIKEKIKYLTSFIDVLSQRQRDIQREIFRETDIEHKDILNNERTTNTVVLRCAGWIKMTLEGKSLKDKLLVDKEFPLWYRETRGYYIWDFLADMLGMKDDDYKFPTAWSSFRPWYKKYFNQTQLFHYIYDMLFPEKMSGIFGFQSDDDIECDIWRTTFKDLTQKEWIEFKEIRGY